MEFSVEDIPVKTHGTNWNEVLAAVKKLKSGKSVCVPVEGTAKSMQKMARYHAGRSGIRIQTASKDGNLYIWGAA